MQHKFRQTNRSLYNIVILKFEDELWILKLVFQEEAD